MREHKYKVWDGKTMSKIFSLDNASYEGFPYPVVDKNGDCNTDANITWLEYTGLKDKNGKEIYEADIVFVSGSNNPKVMKFDTGAFMLEKMYGGPEAYRMEVVGNIYENPELLTDSKR